MAFVHSGSALRPTKIEMLNEWVPRQTWFVGQTPLEPVGAFRFDDPDGEVGIETHLVRTADGQLLQVPFTYRGAPLAGADDWLVGTMTHTALGDRWVYDGCGDPVYVAALVTAVLQGGRQADVFRDNAGTPEQIEPTVRVQGSGESGTEVGGVGLVDVVDGNNVTIIQTSAGTFTLRRVVGGAAPAGPRLTATWGDVTDAVVLVTAATS